MVADSDHREVTVVTDEIWPENTDDTWLYIGSLFIDSRFLGDACNAFLNARYNCDGWEQADTDPHWQYVNRDTEDIAAADIPVTFDRCNRAHQYTVADRWLSLLRNHAAATNHVKAKITGIDLSKTGVDLTAENPEYNEVYRHLLREHFIDARTHFYDSSIQVDYTPIYRPDHYQQRNTAFQSVVESINDPLTALDAVEIVNPDHRSHDRSTPQWKIANLLQLTNITTAATTELFTDSQLPHNQAKLSWKLHDLVTDSMEYTEPAINRFTIAFTPKKQDTDNFYYWRDIQRNDPHTGSLEQFL